jgi:hypothetical protein
MDVNEKDEYMHEPLRDPLWWENYHFNGYDPASGIGITVYTAMKPNTDMREEIIVIYSGNPLIFRNENSLGENALKSGSLKMECVQPLRKWEMCMKDSFERTENGSLADTFCEVECHLLFESDIPPYGYSTTRGNRYEQPGRLRGTMTIDGASVDFHGKGIRDHSWEIRFLPSWGKWYALMGWFKSGALTCAFMDVGGQTYSQGWVRTDTYADIQSIRIHPMTSGDIVKKAHIEVETSGTVRELDTTLLSYVLIPMREEQKRREAVETLVTLDEEGHGFLWYGR